MHNTIRIQAHIHGTYMACACVYGWTNNIHTHTLQAHTIHTHTIHQYKNTHITLRTHLQKLIQIKKTKISDYWSTFCCALLLFFLLLLCFCCCCCARLCSLLLCIRLARACVCNALCVRVSSCDTYKPLCVCVCVCMCMCDVWRVMCEVWCVMCDVWCVMCGVWCVMCGVFEMSVCVEMSVRDVMCDVCVCDVHAIWCVMYV